MKGAAVPNVFEGKPDRVQGRVAIIVSRYNESVTERLLEGALRTARSNGLGDDRIDVVRVPGAWELSLAAMRAASSMSYEAVVCLGAVIRGETTHDEHINRQVSESLGRISLEHGVPIGFGLLTVNNLEQALNRAGGSVGNKGEEATLAALQMADLLASWD